MTLPERFAADFAGMSLTAGQHPMQLVRARLPDVTPAAELVVALDGHTVTIAGSVICRQRPGTAKGVVFISLEDETGIANAILSAEFFEQNRLRVTAEPFLLIEGRVQSYEGTIHIRAEAVDFLPTAPALASAGSHDFH